MKKYLIAGGAALSLAGIGVAVAQVFVPSVLQVNPNDLIAVLVHGNVGPSASYATQVQLTGPVGYHDDGVQTTAFTYTFASGQVNYVIRPAGTLATGTLRTEANPGDGQRECFFSTQTQTALTWTANTGQTMGSDKPTAGVANTLQCIMYEAASATWHRVQ
jgi:hypothetical protein